MLTRSEHGKHVVLSDEEEAEIRARWAAFDKLPPEILTDPKQDQIDQLTARLGIAEVKLTELKQITPIIREL